MPEPTALQSADALLLPRWLLPMEPAGALLTGHAVAIRGDTILDVGPTDALERRWRPRERVELPEHVLLPGLINAHTHAAMTLLRGIGDDLPLRRWLEEAIWPREAALLSEEFVHDGTLIAAAEMLRGGITTAVDMYFYPEAAARAFTAMGMRSVLGITAIDFPTPYAADADEALAKGLAVRDAWREEPLVSFLLAPHAPYSVGDAALERIATLAAQLDLPVQIHLLETAQEREESLARHGETPLERLDRLGLLGPGLVGVHAVHLTENEIALLAERGVALVHCPTSNMKLASGIAAVPQWLDAGIAVGLGTDGAASNNRLDLFRRFATRPCSPRSAKDAPRCCPRYRRWNWPPSAPPAPSGWMHASARSARARPPTSSPLPSTPSKPSPATTPAHISSSSPDASTSATSGSLAGGAWPTANFCCKKATAI